MSTKSIRTIIVGAAGRDFHNFNVVYRNDPRYQVVAFTAAQIPDIAGRKYPASLAGKRYPKGIPIHEEQDLEKLIAKHDVEEVVFSYSDVSYQHVMSLGSRATAAGAHFKLLSATETMIKSRKPVVSICAVRTGSGKSQTSRKAAKILQDMGFRVAAVRHPMPYGDLAKQKVQRYATLADLKKHHCTIEEMEEYEPHIVNGIVIYAGVDYEAILRQAEKDADVIIWDGGNNDLPFYKPDLHMVVADPLRVGNELTYYPSEANLRLADVVIINKIDSALPLQVETLRTNIHSVNPKARIIDAASPIHVERGAELAGKKVLVIEDGPTLTHGEMAIGAGTVAAKKYGAAQLIDPRPYVSGEIQIKDLEGTINRVPADAVIIGTPIDLARIVKIAKPAYRVTYDLEEIGEPNLRTVLAEKFRKTR